jgi:hypothetical protein
MKSVHDLGKGLPFTSKTCPRAIAAAKMCETPISIMNCPTRRPSLLFPVNYPGEKNARCNVGDSNFHARSDYAGNGGDGPDIFAVPNDWPSAATFQWTDLKLFTGVIFQRSTIKPREIIDGLSHTYLLGENNNNPDLHYPGMSFGDSGPMLQGYDWDIIRLGNANHPLFRDRRGYSDDWSFNSAPATTCNFVFWDGSVHAIDYGVDVKVHRLLSSRNDRQGIDSK